MAGHGATVAGPARSGLLSHSAEHEIPVGYNHISKCHRSDAGRFMRIAGIPPSQRAPRGPLNEYRVWVRCPLRKEHSPVPRVDRGRRFSGAFIAHAASRRGLLSLPQRLQSRAALHLHRRGGRTQGCEGLYVPLSVSVSIQAASLGLDTALAWRAESLACNVHSRAQPGAHGSDA
jgi:hypothetical protein